MKKTLLVTGSAGFVAGSVIAHGVRDFFVHAIDVKNPPPHQKNLMFYKLDVRETHQLKNLFQQIEPDAVIHTAAIADIDFCQNHQQLAEEVNVGATQLLAKLCQNFKSKLIFCSTDTVFDGNKGNYVEDDLPCPVNFYAETKIKAENLIRGTIINSVIARLSLVMGLPVLNRGNSFLVSLIEKLKAGEKVEFAANEIRSPIDVITLGRALVELAGNDFIGCLHLAGNDQLTRFAMAHRIAERLGYPAELVMPVNSNTFPGRAPRPDDVSLNNAKAKKLLNTPMRSLLDGVELSLNYQQRRFSKKNSIYD